MKRPIWSSCLQWSFVSIALLLQQLVQHVQTWRPHAWVSKWMKTGFLCHFNRLSLWKITRRRRREMTENEICSGSSKAAPLCGNFIRCSITTKTVQQMSSGSTLMLPLTVSSLCLVTNAVYKNPYIWSPKKKPPNPPKPLGEEQLVKDWMKMQIYNQKFNRSWDYWWMKTMTGQREKKWGCV